MVKRPEVREIATTGDGRDITRPFIGPLLESQDKILWSKGGGNLEVYEKVLQDDQVYAVFQQRRLAVVSTEWDVLPGGDKRLDIKAADALRDNLKALYFDAICDRMLYGIFYGYAVGECLWGLTDGKVELVDVKVRKQRRFKFGREGDLRLLTMQQPVGETLPPRKFWYFATGADNSDDPYGIGLGHWLYWPVFFKRNGIKFWLIFLDKFGMPTGVGKYQPGATEDEKRKLLQAVQALQTDSGIILPEGMLIELLEASRSGTTDYAELLDKMDKAISKVVLGQTMTTDEGGSLAQSQTHLTVRQDIVKADSDLLCQSFNAGPARWLTDWNFPGAAYPQVWRRLNEEEDLNERVQRDQALYAMGWQIREEALPEIYGDDYERKPEEVMPQPGAEAGAQPSAEEEGEYNPDPFEPQDFSEWWNPDPFAPEFAQAKGPKMPRCTRGYPCGASCQRTGNKCRNPLDDQAGDYASWLSQQVAAGASLSPAHQADADTLGTAGGDGEPPAQAQAVKLPQGHSVSLHGAASQTEIEQALNDLTTDDNRQNLRRLSNFIEAEGIQAIVYGDRELMTADDLKAVYAIVDKTVGLPENPTAFGAGGYTNVMGNYIVVSHDSGGFTAHRSNPLGAVDRVKSGLFEATEVNSGGILQRTIGRPGTGEVVYLHEMGHQIHYMTVPIDDKGNRLPKAKGGRLSNAQPWRGKQVSEYSKTDYLESFAEAFVAYTLAPSDYRAFDRKGYDQIDKIMSRYD
ncbi:DUF935 family protein [Synechococcales cyanobacterium C]|uniref:DUF935 family protein n=1 Tax=Petrachloros mirabilis ULC683 TaxID=2781853 RepID=A0A8K2A796_9CYAN|nr:DUF935 family protein [Petrachloros mirabilis]NCJ06666.1 DUF935 family protein [Petrachloros mirabilis ULC683]